MRKYNILNVLSDEGFKRIIGVKRETYHIMLEEFKKYEEERKRNHGIGGRKQKLCEEEKVLFMLEYYREYKTLASIGLEYGISEPVASKLVREVESALIKSGKFSLPSKRALYKDDINLNYVIIDATKMPIQRPKKQKIYYSGKKKGHTQKAQIVIYQNQQIICTHIDSGRTHDFKIFKESKLPLKMDTLVKVDLGYVGIQKIHKKCEIPKKKSKNNPLTKEDKELNKQSHHQEFI